MVITMRVLQVLLAFLCVGKGLAQGDDEVLEAEVETFDLQMLTKWNGQLRSGDKRLMRASPSDETSAKQLKICPPIIAGLVETLNADEGMELRAAAAHTLHLCTTNNPGNRAAIGNIGFPNATSANETASETNADSTASSYATGEGGAQTPPQMPYRHHKDSPYNNVHRGLAMLIADGITVYNNETSTNARRIEATNAIAEASQAIWILAYNNVHNHEAFIVVGAVEALLSVVMSCRVDFDAEEDEDSLCSQAVMWSLAALQNLAATYCDTDDGLCEWGWNDENKMVLFDTYPVGGAGAEVRRRLLHQLKSSSFGRVLISFLFQGPVDQPHSEDYPWPSLSVHDLHRHRPSIIPWAAAGLIKNMALDDGVRAHFNGNQALLSSLCAMSLTSPDSLEESKSTDALYNLGRLGFKCSDPTEDCTDISGWAESKGGMNCTQYEEERWCAEYGMLTDSNGVSANEACCFCWGGNRETHDEL